MLFGRFEIKIMDRGPMAAASTTIPEKHAIKAFSVFFLSILYKPHIYFPKTNFAYPYNRERPAEMPMSSRSLISKDAQRISASVSLLLRQLLKHAVDGS